VVLTKASPTISLVKQDVRGGMLRVNLNWTARPPGNPTSGGFLRRLGSTGAIDLDLGCLFEFTDGSKGVVQALGNAFGAAPRGDSRPLIALDGDDRSGAAAGGENLTIDLDRASSIRRILLFAFIYEGTPNWAEANAVVTWYPVGAPPVVVNLDDHDPRSRLCAIAMLDNTTGQLDLRREVRYIQGAQDALDQAYGWGMNWRAGRK
jgi:tellurite resistance protein TerA